jgi:hypothetical protein
VKSWTGYIQVSDEEELYIAQRSSSSRHQPTNQDSRTIFCVA